MLSLFLFLISREDLRSREIPDEYSIAICMLAVGNGGFSLQRLCLATAVMLLAGFVTGMGDAKLLGALCLLLGRGIGFVIVCAFVLAGAYCALGLASGRLRMTDSIAFAPFISVPALTVFVMDVL